MEGVWNIHKIRKILPQQYPFLFIDKILKVNKKETKVVCLKNVTINDSFFQGHFPDNPVMPGTIIIEAMAQAAIVAYFMLKPQVMQKNPDFYLGKVEAKFKKPVKVGDQLILEAIVEKVIDSGGIVKTFAKVDDEVVAEARIAFGVKIKDKLTQ